MNGSRLQAIARRDSVEYESLLLQLRSASPEITPEQEKGFLEKVEGVSSSLDMTFLESLRAAIGFLQLGVKVNQRAIDAAKAGEILRDITDKMSQNQAERGIK